MQLQPQTRTLSWWNGLRDSRPSNLVSFILLGRAMLVIMSHSWPTSSTNETNTPPPPPTLISKVSW